MRFDLDTKPQTNDYVTVPAGTYLCKITDVNPGTTKNGDVRWGIRLVVAEGEFTGRQAAWDGLVFSPRGMARVRSILGALGLPNTGSIDLEPEHLQDRPVFVEVRPSEYRHPDTGELIRRNDVPYSGYRRVAEQPDGETPAAAPHDEIPF